MGQNVRRGLLGFASSVRAIPKSSRAQISITVLSDFARGLDPWVSSFFHRRMGGYMYLMTNHSRRPIYCGSTSDLIRRVYEHREGLIPNAYTGKYRLFQLVHYEVYDDMSYAFQRERNIKHWSRDWKAELIEKYNPDWRDLWPEIAQSPF